MQFIAPDLLADARGLSLPLCSVGLVVGLALWLLGWWGHRFWVVLFTTVAAGIYGLTEAPSLRVQPVVAALLLAVAAGMLALALVRLVAFAAAGFAMVAAVQATAPAPEHGLILFAIGGIVGVILFRPWLMVLTSLGGTWLAVHSALCLAEGLGKLEAAAWAESHTTLLNWLCGPMAGVGLLVQFLLHRRRAGSTGKTKEPKKAAPPPEPVLKVVDEKPKPRMWGAGLFRKAG